MSVLQFGAGIDIDDPVRSSQGKNPAVLALVRGRPWGVACKVLNGRNVRSYKDLVRGGVEQIERSNADNRVVVVSLANLLDHDSLFPKFPQPDERIRYGA